MSKKCEKGKKNEKRKTEEPDMLNEDPRKCSTDENNKCQVTKDQKNTKSCTKMREPQLLPADPLHCMRHENVSSFSSVKTCTKKRDTDGLPGSPPHCLPDENDVSQNIKSGATSNPRKCNLDPCRLDTSSRSFKCDDKCKK